MIVLDKTYFYGDIHIPNLSENVVLLNEAELSFPQWEREAFTHLLGGNLYRELMSKIEYDDEKKSYQIKDGEDSKWSDLWNGTVFSCNCGCKETEWSGFVIKSPINVRGEIKHFKRSIIAYYAYYMWALSNNTHTSGTGEQKPQTKNSEWVNNVKKRTRAWNTFVSQSKSLQCFAKENFDNYCGIELDYKTTIGI